MARKTSPIASAPALKVSPVIRLHNPVDQDYVDAVRALLLKAERGESIGLAYIEITNGGNYFAKATGEAERSPTYCIGAIEVLKAKLLKQVMG